MAHSTAITSLVPHVCGNVTPDPFIFQAANTPKLRPLSFPRSPSKGPGSEREDPESIIIPSSGVARYCRARGQDSKQGPPVGAKNVLSPGHSCDF